MHELHQRPVCGTLASTMWARAPARLLSRRPRRLSTQAWSKREAQAPGYSSREVNRRLAETPAPSTGFVPWFTRMLTDYPLRTNALTGATLGAAGDAAAQYCEYCLDIMSPGKNKYNWQRTVNMAAFGCVSGPIFSAWYRGLDKAAKAVAVHYETRLGIKVVADNLLAAPMMLHLYYGLMGLLEGRSPEQILDNMRSSFYKAWALGVSVWIPVQFVNFHAFPVYLQPVVINTFDVCYKLTLSLLNHRVAYGKPAEGGSLEAGWFPGEKAAPALQFDWPSPTHKLHTVQLANAELQQVVATQAQRIEAQDAQIAELSEEVSDLRGRLSKSF